MKILQIQMENIGPLDEVNIILPESGIIEISGKNATGKSSILLALRYLLGGIPKNDNESMLKKGTNKGEITAYIGENSKGEKELVDGTVKNWEYKLTRIYTEGGTRVQVEIPGGGVLRTPQKVIDQFVKDIAFDPLQLLEMPQKEQTELLLKLFPVDFSKDKLWQILEDNGIDKIQLGEEESPIVFMQRVRNDIYEARKDINKDLAKAKQMTEGIEIPEVPDKIDSVSIADLIKRKNDLLEIEKNNTLKRDYLIKLKSRQSEKENQIDELRKQIENIESDLEEIESEIYEQEDICKSLIDPAFDEIDQEIEQADETNKQASEYKEKLNAYNNAISNREHWITEMKLKEKASNAHTQAINEIDQYKQYLIKNAQFPVKYLSIGDENNLIYKDVSLNRAGQSEQIIISCQIYAALKPKLKVILSPQETQLDKEHREILRDWAIKNGYQILYCKVLDEKEEGSFYIEEGKLINV